LALVVRIVILKQDEAAAAAIKTVELDAALGGRAVQYREVQGHETEKFLSYFKPCIIPQEGGVASGFKHAEAEKHKTRLFVCRGKHVVHVKEASLKFFGMPLRFEYYMSLITLDQACTHIEKHCFLLAE